jgi:GNAT superfamily N-acetyltransferase
MSQLLDPNYNRASILPLGRHKQTGKLSLAVPGIAADLLSALMLPGDVYQGNVLMNDPATGHTSDEVIRRSADLAGAMTLGSGAIPAEANSLRMGLKYSPAPDGVEIKQLSPSYLIAKSGGKEVGQISLSEKNPFVSLIQVDPNHRGRGVGSALYSEAEKALGRDLVPSPLGLSDDAKKFWRKQFAQMPREEAQKLINQAREIGLSYGIKPEHIETRLGDLLQQ